MAYDDDLAHLIRETLADEPDLTEKVMFGGLGFMLAGHMAVASNNKGGLMARLDPGDADELIDAPAIVPTVMQGRELRGWIDVDSTTVTDDHVAAIVRRSAAYVRTLPPKRPKPPKKPK